MLLFSKFSLNLESKENPAMFARSEGFVRVTCLTDLAFPPERHSFNSPALDLLSPIGFMLAPRSRRWIQMDLEVQAPPGCYIRLTSINFYARAFGLEVGSGVVEPNTSNLGVLLYNHSEEKVPIRRGQPIAHMICEQYKYVTMVHTARDGESWSYDNLRTGNPYRLL